MCLCHFHNRLFQYHLLRSAFFIVFNGDPLVNATFIYCGFLYFTRFSSISFDLKKVGKVREVFKQFKGIGIMPIRIIPKSVSLFELQIDLASSIVFSSKFSFL